MTSATLASLVQQVEELVANPSTTPAATGDESLDRALTELQKACAAGQPIESGTFGFWV
jgi:hypothetical protein